MKFRGINGNCWVRRDQRLDVLLEGKSCVKALKMVFS